MNGIESLPTWALENTIVAALFAGVVLVVTRFLRERPGQAHVLWLVALFVLLMPTLPLGDHPGARLRRSFQAFLSPAEEQAVQQPIVYVSGSYQAAPTTLDTPVAPPLANVAPKPSFFANWKMRQWLLAVWVVGAVVLLTRSMIRILRFQRLVRRATRAPLSLRREVERVARHLRVDAPRVRMLGGVASPSVWCFGRPTLLWPDGVRVSEARETLIAHELAHLARKDHWVSWLEVPAAALLWWNPLFWLIRGRIRHFAELSCDAWAVRAYPADRRAFAEALIDLQAKTVTAPVALQGLGATDSEFKDFERRLDMIMKKRVSPRVSRGVVATAALAAVLVSPGFSAGDEKSHGYNSGLQMEPAVAVLTHVKSVKRLDEAERLFGKKDFAAALAAYEDVLELDPTHGHAHGRMGYILIGNGQYAEAIEHFLKQFELGISRPTALYNIACAKTLSGEHDASLGFLEKAVAYGFADLGLLNKDTDLAALRSDERFEAIVDRTQLGKDLAYKVRELEKADDLQTLFVLHTELANIRSSDAAVLSRQGHLALKFDEPETAVWAFARQAEVGDNVPTALYNVACAQARLGDADAALDALGRAADAGMIYGGIVKDEDLDTLRYDDRFVALQKRIAEPAEAAMKVKMMLDSGQPKKAMPLLAEMANDESRTRETRAWAAGRLAAMQLERDRHEDALTTYRNASGLGLRVDEFAFGMAEALAGMGDDGQALVHVDYALDLGYADPARVRALLEANALCASAEIEQRVERASLKQKYAGKGYGKKKQDGYSSYGKDKLVKGT